MERTQDETPETTQDTQNAQAAPVTTAVAPRLAKVGANLAALFGTDADKENAGAWLPLAPGVRIKLRSQQSRVARDVANRQIIKTRHLGLAGVMDQDVTDAADVELCAQAIVAAWEGITDDAGAEIPCTPQTVAALMTELPHLRRQVLAFAGTIDNYR